MINEKKIITLQLLSCSAVCPAPPTARRCGRTCDTNEICDKTNKKNQQHVGLTLQSLCCSTVCSATPASRRCVDTCNINEICNELKKKKSSECWFDAVGAVLFCRLSGSTCFTKVCRYLEHPTRFVSWGKS